MSRIEAVFAKTRAEGRSALIPFIMAYDGGREFTKELLDYLAENGADLIEIGVPFSDPMADGVIIQEAGARGLAAGASLAGILEIVGEFRKNNEKIPVILMGYYNPVYRYGSGKFCKDAAKAGVDGVIIVDLPPEEEAEITPDLKNNNIDFIRLIAPTSEGERLAKLTANASGFIYYIAVAGITGGKSANAAHLAERLALIRSYSALPIAVGFGIKSAKQAAELKGIADAVVVGSALVDIIHQAGNNAQHKIAAACDFIKELAAAIRT